MARCRRILKLSWSLSSVSSLSVLLMDSFFIGWALAFFTMRFLVRRLGFQVRKSSAREAPTISGPDLCATRPESWVKEILLVASEEELKLFSLTPNNDTKMSCSGVLVECLSIFVNWFACFSHVQSFARVANLRLSVMFVLTDLVVYAYRSSRVILVLSLYTRFSHVLP